MKRFREKIFGFARPGTVNSHRAAHIEPHTSTKNQSEPNANENHGHSDGNQDEHTHKNHHVKVLYLHEDFYAVAYLAYTYKV